MSIHEEDLLPSRRGEDPVLSERPSNLKNSFTSAAEAALTREIDYHPN
jgi:hypothetical protein